MLTVSNTKHFRIESPTIVTIGTFDGVHLGHQKILDRLKELKLQTGLKTVVFTFEPHPRSVLFPLQTDLKLITLVDEKLELLKKYGVDVTVVYPFDRNFSEIEARQYIEEILVKNLRVKYLVIGYDHRFGKNRSGDINLLKQFAGDYNYQVEEISAMDIDDIAISSSKIRHALEAGDVELASSFLGHHFFINGQVIHGKKLGRQIGFPTANLKIASGEKIIPKKGVYFVEVIIEDRNLFGMMNIGTNPTTDQDDTLKLEVNIFDFDEDIYNKNIRVNFIKYLRDEEKFTNLDVLIEHLNKDKENCLELIKTHAPV